MAKSIISLILLVVSVGLGLKHGWDTLNYKNNPGSVKMMEVLGISESVIPFLGILTITISVLLLMPKTFFLGNVLNAITIVMIMALALRAGDLKTAFIEIPFLALPLIMIWLKYPFKF